MVAARPDPHHDRLILPGQLRQLTGTQRGDSHRAGIVLVGLVDLPRIEQPDPGGQLGRHVQHPFAGGDQLLREQLPQLARPLDRPRPLSPTTGPAQQLYGLLRRCPHPFDDGAMTFPEEDLPDVAKAAHEVVQEAQDAGVWVSAVGWKARGRASWPPTGRSPTARTRRPRRSSAGFAVVDVSSHEEALDWAANIAVACRCAQEVRELLPDPTV